MTGGSSSSGRPAYLDEKGWRYAQACGWPLSAITDPSKFPKIVETREDFIRELMCGDHVHEVVIFRNGLKAFGLDKSIEKPIQECIDKSKSMQELLLHMRNLPDVYKARFCYDNKKLGRQKEIGAGDCKRTMFSKLDEIAKDHTKFPGIYVRVFSISHIFQTSHITFLPVPKSKIQFEELKLLRCSFFALLDQNSQKDHART